MNPLKIFSSRPARRAALLYGGAALACAQIPLLNTLGYEFSALLALLGSGIAGMLAIAMVFPVVHNIAVPDEQRAAQTLRAFADAVLLNLLLLLIPLSLISANAFLVRNCSMTEGFGFFLLLPVPGVIFASALGLFCAAHYAHPRTAFTLLCLALLAYSAVLGYFTPAIFSYNFLYGYFPGFTYDEMIPLSGTLVLFRLITLLVSACLVWMGSILLEECDPAVGVVRKGFTLIARLVSPRRLPGTAAVVLALAILYAYRCELGFESSAAFIQRSLGAKLVTDNCIIYYDSTSFSREEIRRVGAEHEFRLHQVTAAFALPHAPHMESYVYPSAEAKLRLIGAGNTDIAKPWSDQIHVTKESMDASLKHEMVHVAAGPFGLPVLCASASTGLVEGLAMAVDGEWGNRTLHEYAAAMQEFGAARDIRSLMTPWGFGAQQSSVSYVLAGSFCRFLIERFGMRKMLQLYGSLNYRSVYGRSLDELVTEWQGFLERVPLDSIDRDGIDAFFRRPTIFMKVCPRVLARRMGEARREFDRTNYAVAESLYTLCFHAGRTTEAFSGRLACALRRGEYAVLTEALDSVIVADEHPARYLPLFLGIGDAYWATGDTGKAEVLFDRLYHADLTEGLTEAAAVRLVALAHPEDAGRMLPLFLSDAGDSVRGAWIDSLLLSDPGDQLLQYLKGKVLLRLGNAAAAASVLGNVAFAEDDELEAIRLRMLGKALFRAGRYEESRAAFWTSLNAVDTDVAEEHIDTWLDRCEWMNTHGF